MKKYIITTLVIFSLLCCLVGCTYTPPEPKPVEYDYYDIVDIYQYSKTGGMYKFGMSTDIYYHISYLDNGLIKSFDLHTGRTPIIVGDKSLFIRVNNNGVYSNRIQLTETDFNNMINLVNGGDK